MINSIEDLKKHSEFIVLNPNWDNDWAAALWGVEGSEAFYKVSPEVWAQVTDAVKNSVVYTQFDDGSIGWD